MAYRRWELERKVLLLLYSVDEGLVLAGWLALPPSFLFFFIFHTYIYIYSNYSEEREATVCALPPRVWNAEREENTLEGPLSSMCVTSGRHIPPLYLVKPLETFSLSLNREILFGIPSMYYGRKSAADRPPIYISLE